jgi:hypothetical protein
MTSEQLDQYLTSLSLSQTEAAKLLGVSPRSVRRWCEGDEIPGPVQQVFRAWMRLHNLNLAWRPDSVSIDQGNLERIAKHREHAIDLSECLARVENRVHMPWEVDRIKCRAVLGKLEVSYYKLKNGGFSLAHYTRKDCDPDVHRDRDLIDDATYCIAQAMKMELDFGPVLLHYVDRPWKSGVQKQFIEECPSNEKAIQRVCELMESNSLHDPFITCVNNPSENVIYDKRELRREYERRKKIGEA